MALLDWINDATGPVVKGQGVTLRPPRAADHEAWATLRQASYAWLQPWEPLWPEDDLTRALRRGSQDTINQTGQQIVRRQLNVQPTLTIRPGHPLRVVITRDLVLEPIGAIR